MSLEYINANTKMISIYGKIIGLPGKTISNNANPNLGAFNTFRETFEIESSDSIAKFNKRKIVIIQFRNGEHMNVLYDVLQGQCNFFGIGKTHIEGVGAVFSAVLHTNTNRIRIEANFFDVVECIVPKIKGQRRHLFQVH